MLDATEALLDEIEEILELPDEPAPLTLADLMRKGAEMGPQAIGKWEGQNGATCALSAAYYAAKAEDLI